MNFFSVDAFFKLKFDYEGRFIINEHLSVVIVDIVQMYYEFYLGSNDI